MRKYINVTLPFCIAFFAVSSYSQIPSVVQTTWHGGPEGSDSLEKEFYYTFLEEDSICWQSAGRLSLFYPVLNQIVYSGFSSGIQTAAGDFIGTEAEDLVVASSNSMGDIILLENPGNSGEWSAATIATGFTHCRTVAGCDVNGDGNQDVVFGCYIGNGIGWLENPGSRSVWIFHAVGTISGINSVDCRDIDNDGDQDIVFCSAGRDTLGCMINLDGFGNSWNCETISTDDFPFNLVVADINSDSVLDVVACYRNADKVYWFERNATRNSWIRHAVADVPGACCVSEGDANGDSYTDILVCGLDSNSVFLCLNQNGSGLSWLNNNLQLNMSNNPKSCLLIDLNGDNDLDMAVSSQLQDSVLIISSCNTSEALQKTSLVIENPISMCHIDSDGNGIQEIACICQEGMHLLSADPSNFSSNGNLTSVVTMLPAGTDYVVWGDILWDSVEPAGTDISFQVRASDDPWNMGEWSDTIWVNGTFLGNILPVDPRYIQYRAFLYSASPDSTPVLNSVTLEGWNPGSIYQGGSEVSGCMLISVESNPSFGSVKITLAPCTDGFRELRIFDIYGRAVVIRIFEPSDNSVSETVRGLASGMYHIQAVAGSRIEILKICVLN